MFVMYVLIALVGKKLIFVNSRFYNNIYIFGNRFRWQFTNNISYTCSRCSYNDCYTVQ